MTPKEKAIRFWEKDFNKYNDIYDKLKTSLDIALQEHAEQKRDKIIKILENNFDINILKFKIEKEIMAWVKE